MSYVWGHFRISSTPAAIAIKIPTLIIVIVIFLEMILNGTLLWVLIS
jgi:hypothetical protein